MIELVFYGSISDDTIRDLIEDIEDANGDQVILYFASPGGGIGATNVFIDYINNKCESEIEFVGFEELGSAAFSMFFQLNCKKRLLPYTTGFFHKYRIKFPWWDVKRKITMNKYKVICEKESNEALYKFYKDEIGLSEHHLKEFSKGKDVVITCSEFNNLLSWNNRYKESKEEVKITKKRSIKK
jgi:hypothetical protein